MPKVLVIRLSSLGDVAMLVPAVYSVAARYPHDKFTVMTRVAFLPLFQNLGFNINTIAFDPVRHKNIGGLMRLTKRVAKFGFSYIADEHDVLRTKIMRNVLRLSMKKVARIDKGRPEKTEFVNTKEVNGPLKSSIERYMDVFAELGFPAELTYTHFFEFTQRDFYLLRSVVNAEEKIGKWIGIAPFAKHDEKIYPLDKMEHVVKTLSEDSNNRIFLFGGSNKEKAILEKWVDKYPNVTSVAGQFSLTTELLLMSYLDVMVSMDSANMHLASLVQLPVVSVWGSTHPDMGFYGYKQDKNNAVFADINCRPCSVFGDKECERGDIACMNDIPESAILNKIQKVLDTKSV